MYRNYENPYGIEEEIREKEKYIEEQLESGADAEDLIWDYQELEDLKEQLNFAWQDDEYDWLNRDV